MFGFIYFELTKFNTVSFNETMDKLHDETFQSCGIYRNINNSRTIITTSLSIIMCVNHKQL